MTRKWIHLILVLFFVLSACRLSTASTPTQEALIPETGEAPAGETPAGETPGGEQPGETSTPLEPTETPKVSATLSASLESAAPLDGFLADTPIVLRFNQAMNPDSASPVLLTYPWINGTTTWDEAATTVTFTPTGRYGGGKRYSVYVNPYLQTTTGEVFAQPPNWQLTVLESPEVVEHTPGAAKLADLRPSIALRFDQEMNAESVAAALSVTPAVPFSLAWEDGAQAVVQLLQDLAPGTRYQFTLSDSALDQHGMAMAEEVTWSYWLDALVADINGPTFDNPSAPFTVRFNYAMNQDSVGRSISVSPAVALSAAWNEAGTELRLVPGATLPRGAFYTLNFNASMLDSAGRELPPPGPILIAGPPPILGVYPDPLGTADPSSEIRITFDRPMDHAKTEAAFQIEPEVAGSFAWRENTIIFTPAENMAYGFHTVKIDPSAAGADGSPILLETFEWQFDVYPQYDTSVKAVSFGDYGPNGQVLDVDGRRAIQFVAYETNEVVFELYSLQLDQFLDRYSSGFRGVAGQQYQPIQTDDLPRLASWTQATSGDGVGWFGNVYETLLPGDVPLGLYILNARVDQLNAQLILVLTRNTLAVKQAEGQIVAWVSDINGGSAPNAEVSIYARDGVLVAQGAADANGIYRTEVGRDPQPLIVVARVGSDLTVSGLSDEWRSTGNWWGWWWSEPKSSDYAVYLYTDRPIYRPGQTMFFKAIVRNDDDAALSVPPEGTAVTLRVRDGRDNVVQTFNLSTNAFGSATGEFAIAEGAMLGEYQIEAAFDDEIHRQSFKVQDYRKPDFQVSVTADQAYYVTGDNVTISVNAAYLFGHPVANGSLKLSRYYLESYYDYWSLDDSRETQYIWYADYEYEPIETYTDANGNFSTSFTASLGEYYSDNYDWSSHERSRVYGVEATVDDGSGQTVSSFVVVRVHRAAERIEVEAGGFIKSPGEAFTIYAEVSTLDSLPVGGRDLQIELRRWSRDTYAYDIVVQTSRMATGTDGKASMAITPEQPGYYQLRLSGFDGRGNPIFVNRWIYVFSGNNTWWNDYVQNLRITPDQESYLPGENARLLIESTFSGPALITFERGRVHREQVVQLNAPITTLDLPIQADDAPNIFVTVSAWEAQDTTLTNDTYYSLSDSKLRTATTEIIVPVPGKTLNISITPDRAVYAPRDQASFTVQVTDENGQPVVAEVSLGMVDEAIYSLSEELSGPIFEAFYAPRENIVRSYDSLALERELMVGGRGGGGGDEAALGPRSDFPDTAAWFPTLTTDANGLASVALTLPDSLTSWRLTAKAVTADTQVGETYINVLTQKEIIVRPILPRSLTAGDQVELTALVHNYSGSQQNLQVSLVATGVEAQAMHIAEPVIQDISLAPGEVRAVGWLATALQAGEALITIAAQSSAETSDAVQLPLPIQPLAVPEVVNQTGVFEGELVTTLFLPEGALPTSSAKIELSRSVAGNLLTGLEYLTGYPYGCVEQTMSRALPNAVVGRAFSQLGVSNVTLEADLPRLINAGLQRLYGYQHNDGGWGWWYDDATNDYQTAWVVFGLSVTAQAGYEVDPNVIARGAAWLKNNLGEMEIRTQAYALYSLALAGQGDLAVSRALLARLYELDVFSQAGLALALQALGDLENANLVLNTLAESAEQRDGLVYWPQPVEDGHYYDKTMASTTRSTALALDAFIKINPNHGLVPGILQWLMSQRRLDGWGSTNETSFTILALTDHLLTVQEATESTGYVATLNDQILAQGTLGKNEPAIKLEIPASQMQTGLNVLRVAIIGPGRLYYNLTNRTYLPQGEIDASGDIVIQREFLDAQTYDPVTTVRPGQLVRVRLTISLPRNTFFLILEDKLPGGLEALNESLNITSHEATAFDWLEPNFTWQSYRYNQKEVHGDRVSFFFSELPEGIHTVEYVTRATFAGLFVALPTEASAMYDSSLWGRSASSVFMVQK